MTYRLGSHSNNELVGVHPLLIKVVRHAIQITYQDFTVHDGLRTVREQQAYVASGVSQIMASKHLPQSDMLGHAVDLVPYINGKLRWEWIPIFKICSAMRIAAKQFDVSIRWGGCWYDIKGSTISPELMVEEYAARKRRAGKKSFPDGPHYELML